MPRRLKSTLPVLALVLTTCACTAHRPAALPGGAATGMLPSPGMLAATWDAEHVSRPLPPLVRHADVVGWLQGLPTTGGVPFHVEQIGQSVEGRSLNHLWFGHGPLHVLLWSQMHGDEPSATSALFDVFDYVHRHRDDPVVRAMLDRLTIHVVPMLNPDGAERFQRRNAQGIDINRDALLLQSPEGRALKTLRDRLDPPIGFNLHNQNWRTSAGQTGQPASISLLSVAYDEARSENAGRIRTKKVCAIIRDALEELAPGRIARYDDEFEVRAFGDNMTKWGTSTVLIETGAWPGEAPDQALVRLNFVALVTALEALATGEVDRASPARYESLPMNDSAIFYRLIRHASVVTGNGIEPFTADVGLVISRTVHSTRGERRLRTVTRIDDLGDLRGFAALEAIDGTGLTLAPVWDKALTPGAEVSMPDWKGWTGATVAVGQPGDLVLLKPAGNGRFTVERVLSADGTSPGAHLN